MGKETSDSGRDGPALLPPICPRCGYDLSGTTATWTGCCPLSGVCSECGYEFEWADVLLPERQRKRWLYEHATHWWRLDKAITTLVMTAYPIAFWRRVQPHVRIRTSRLALWPIVILVALTIICVLYSALVHEVLRQSYGVWPGRRPRPITMSDTLGAIRGLLPIDVAGYAGGRRHWWFNTWFCALLLVIAYSAGALIVCLVGQSHWIGLRIRRAHFLRVAALGASPAVWFGVLFAINWMWSHVATIRAVARGAWGWPPIGFPWAPPQWMSEAATEWRCLWDEVAMLVWLWIWWWAALRIGLRVRGSGTMVVAACLTGTLGALAFAALSGAVTSFFMAL